MNKFETKKMELEYLERMYEVLEYAKRDIVAYYGNTGKQEPRTKWNRDKGAVEPVLDDNGEQIMDDIWDYIPKDEKALTEDDRARIKIIENLMKKLEGMM